MTDRWLKEVQRQSNQQAKPDPFLEVAASTAVLEPQGPPQEAATLDSGRIGTPQGPPISALLAGAEQLPRPDEQEQARIDAILAPLPEGEREKEVGLVKELGLRLGAGFTRLPGSLINAVTGAAEFLAAAPTVDPRATTFDPRSPAVDPEVREQMAQIVRGKTKPAREVAEKFKTAAGKITEDLPERTLAGSPFRFIVGGAAESGIPSLGTAIITTAITGSPLAGLSVMAATEFGSEFEEQRQSGATALKAGGIGAINAGIELATESFTFPGIGKLLKGKGTLKQIFSEVAKNFGEETVAGFSQTFMSVYGTETTAGKSDKEAAQIALDAAAKTFPGEGLIGAVTAGGAVAVGGLRTALKTPKEFNKQAAIDEIRQNNPDLTKEQATTVVEDIQKIDQQLIAEQQKVETTLDELQAKADKKVEDTLTELQAEADKKAVKPVVAPVEPAKEVKPTVTAPKEEKAVEAKQKSPVLKPEASLVKLGEAQQDLLDTIKKRGHGGIAEQEQHPEVVKARRFVGSASNELFDSVSQDVKIGDKIDGFTLKKAKFDLVQSVDTQRKTGFPATFKFMSVKGQNDKGEWKTFFRGDKPELSNIDTSKVLKSVTQPQKTEIAERQAIQEEQKLTVPQGGFLEGLEPIKAFVPKQGPKTPQELPLLKSDPVRKAQDSQEFTSPKTPKLPGGRLSGSTTLMSDAIEESQAIGRAVLSPVQTAPKDFTSMLKNAVKRANRIIKTYGEPGKKLSKDIDDIAFRSQRNENNDALDIRKVFRGLNKSQRIQVAKFINGETAIISKKLEERAKRLTEILDRSMNEAASLGVERIVGGKKIPLRGSGEAYPQVLNKAGIQLLDDVKRQGLASAEVAEVAQFLFDEGQADDLQDAINKLSLWREQRMRGVNRYLESERIKLPEKYVEWDGSKTLPPLISKNWLMVEGVRKWGVQFNKVDNLIEDIRAEMGNHQADQVKQFIRSNFGAGRTSSPQSERLSNALRSYQFNTKVALSPLTIIRNMTDRLPKGLQIAPWSVNLRALAKYPPFLNKFIRSSRKIEEDMIRSGAVFGHGSLAEGFEPGNVLSKAVGTAFSSSERGNQVHLALVKKLAIERDIMTLSKMLGKNDPFTKVFDSFKTIIGQSQKQVKNRLRELGTEDLVDRLAEGEGLDKDVLDAVLHRAVRDHTFPVILSTKRIWWDNHPWARVIAQFKTWPVEQTSLIYNDVLKGSVKTGDMTKLIRWIVGTFLVGELYNILRDLLLDRDESVLKTLSDKERRNVKQITRAVLGDFLDGGGVGMLADFTYGLFDWLSGVSFNTGKNIVNALDKTIKRPKTAPHAIKQLIEKETTAIRQAESVWNKIDRMTDPSNITDRYYITRKLAWEYRERKEAPEIVDKGKKVLEDVIHGFEKYRPGKNTLVYEMAARQIMAGDPQDAAKHLAIIFKDAKDHKAALKGVKLSANAKSPLGPIAKRDRAAFLNTLTKQQRTEALRIQRIWEKSYAEAIRMARIEALKQRNK